MHISDSIELLVQGLLSPTITGENGASVGMSYGRNVAHVAVNAAAAHR
jgi:hypothetical protein